MTTSESWVVLKFAGEIDLARIDELNDKVAANSVGPCPDMTIDLSEVTFMDSTGLAWLIRARDLVLAKGRRFKVISPPNLDRLFELTGLTEQFDFGDANGPSIP